MPQDFEFRSTDAYVTRLLTAEEIQGVKVWQSPRLGYQFSFHTQHEAGWPCYLKEEGGPGRGLPKINLKEHNGTVLQGKTIVDDHVGKDFKAVVNANVKLFQKLAEAYYEGEEEEEVRGPAWVVEFSCSMDKKGKSKPVLIKLPTAAQRIGSAYWANMKVRASKPRCPLHRVDTCMEGVAKQVQYQEATQVRQRFDGNSQIQDE